MNKHRDSIDQRQPSLCVGAVPLSSEIYEDQMVVLSMHPEAPTFTTMI